MRGGSPGLAVDVGAVGAEVADAKVDGGGGGGRLQLLLRFAMLPSHKADNSIQSLSVSLLMLNYMLLLLILAISTLF